MTGRALCLRILCAVALLFVGFAHQPVFAAGPNVFELSRYVLPDGTIGDICLDDHVEGKVRHHLSAKCEACRIGGSLLMPVPSDVVGAVLAFRRVVVLPLGEEALHPRRERPGAPPRAPPFLSA
ncbi:hypothetical protein [Shinella sp.]|uniref:hypothetical protein n=1 Tax=Shinella sp. TaxID=1870904 RepID=UPI0039E3F494